MRTIWKYELTMVQHQSVNIKAPATILAVAMQFGKLCLWAEVNTDMPEIERHVSIYGTGDNIDQVGRHISTYQVSGGEYVFHAYDTTKTYHQQKEVNDATTR